MSKIYFTLTRNKSLFRKRFPEKRNEDPLRKRTRQMSMTRKQSKLLMKALEKSGMWRTVPILLLVNR